MGKQGLYRLFPPELTYVGPMRLALKLAEDAEASHACGMCKGKILSQLTVEEAKAVVEAQAKALNKVENGGLLS